MKTESLKVKQALINHPKLVESILKNFINEIKKETEKENSEWVQMKNTVVPFKKNLKSK